MIQSGYPNTEYHGPMLVEIRREVGDILGKSYRQFYHYSYLFYFFITIICNDVSSSNWMKYSFKVLVSIDALKLATFTLKA